MISGGIGGMFYYNKITQHISESNSHDEYTIKNKDIREASIKLNGNANVLIQTSSEKKVTMDSQNSRLTSLNSSLTVNESGDKLTINATVDKNQLKIKGIEFGFFDTFDSQVVITIPSSIEKLVIEGNEQDNITLSDLDTKAITIDSKNADIYLQSIISDSLTVSTVNGSIDLDQIIGTSKLTSDNGSISIRDVTDTIDAHSTNGDIDVNGSDLPKELTAKTTNGDISIYSEIVLYDVSIDAKSVLGDVTLLNREKTTYKQGKAKHRFDLESRFGDIRVDAPSDYDTEDED